MARKKQKLQLVETVDSTKYDEGAKRYFIDTAGGRKFSVSTSLGSQHESRLTKGTQVTLSVNQDDVGKFNNDERVHATGLEFPKSSGTPKVRTREG